MAGEYSKQALLTYLREAALSGRLHPAVARSRHKAAEALLTYISEEEAADLRRLDLPALETQLVDLPRGNLRPEVVALYTQRLSEALEEYFSAATTLGAAATDAITGPGGDGSAVISNSEDRSALEAVRLSFNRYRADIVPIPLGPDRVVYLHDVPPDLTVEEARKIARVVEALGSPVEGDP
jgi:hypothetical protein